MSASDFDYDLPERCIAQDPLPERDASRLLVLSRRDGSIRHQRFREIPDLLCAGDLLVLNDTRVVPARLIGARPTGGKVELLLLERVGGSEAAPEWECLARAAKPLRAGARVDLHGGLYAVAVERRESTWVVRLDDPEGRTVEKIAAAGQVPLPPYIRRGPDDPRSAADRARYQTVYARQPGAVAAPTAGLHFTERVLDAVRARGVEIASVTLHTGPGTFLPVRVERLEDHRMHAESFEIPAAAAQAVERTRGRGGRVLAVGTTVVRALEASAEPQGRIRQGSGRCDLFIHPGHEFRVVDGLLTNFHLPRSTLLMLVCALAGRQNVLRAYGEAIQAGYRFYSFGDAMWIA